MITHIFNDRVYHCDINNKNCMHDPEEGKDWRFIKIVSDDYVDLTQAEIDAVLEREGEEEALKTYINTGENWSIGEDLNDNCKFKISNSETIGVNDRLIIDTHGNWQIPDGIIGSVPPFSMTFHANYNTDLDGNIADGDLVGTPGGSPPPTVNDGLLDLTGGTANYVDYDAILNADSRQTGTIRLLWTPNYTGSPSVNTTIFNISKAPSDSTNSIKILHLSTGNLRLLMYDGTNSFFLSFMASWTATADQEYEFELNYDITAGATRLFIDGNLLGVVQTATGTRSAAIGLIRIGSDESGVQASDFKVNNITIYNAVQHTEDYTPTSAEFESDRLGLSFFGNERTGFLQTGDSLDLYADGNKLMSLRNDGTIEMTTERGLLPPRLTTAERDAIRNPEAGLQIYNTTTNLPNFYNGTEWRAI